MNRRHWLAGLGATLGGAWLAGCDAIYKAPAAARGLAVAQGVNRTVQRLFIGRTGLAREFEKKDISSFFKANGTLKPWGPAYEALLTAGFADWRLVIDGLVERPMSLTLADIKAMPSRTQITRHDCVEGWSSIGEWKGTPLGPLLEKAGLKKNARYIVFHCLDNWGKADGDYYESIDLVDAHHPQTILAYDMNGQPLPVEHGAPLRLRVERQLGYKHAKYIKRIEVVESFDQIGFGKGGFWPDRGYEWYAGI